MRHGAEMSKLDLITTLLILAIIATLVTGIAWKGL
jgi:hypothetical protein